VISMLPIVSALLVGVLLAGAWLTRGRGYRRLDANTYRVVISLHAIRRRLEVAQVRTEVRRDAAHVRRRLRDELRGLDQREGRP
jgi:hypothetical protein